MMASGRLRAGNDACGDGQPWQDLSSLHLKLDVKQRRQWSASSVSEVAAGRLECNCRLRERASMHLTKLTALAVSRYCPVLCQLPPPLCSALWKMS